MLTYLILFVIVFGASFIQGATGFGFAMIVMALLPLLMPLKAAAVLTSVCVCCTGAMLSWKFRRSIDFKLVFIPILAALSSVSVGTYILTISDESILKPALGFLIIILTLFLFINSSRKISIQPTTKNGFLAGVVSGVMTGMFNIGGPPLVIYYIHAAHSNLTYKVSLEFTYFVTSAVVVFSHLLIGNFEQVATRDIGLTLVAVLSGSLVGLKLFRFLNKNVLTKIVYGVLILSALLLIFT